MGCNTLLRPLSLTGLGQALDDKLFQFLINVFLLHQGLLKLRTNSLTISIFFPSNYIIALCLTLTAECLPFLWLRPELRLNSDRPNHDHLYHVCDDSK